MKKWILALSFLMLINCCGCTKTETKTDPAKPAINNLFTEVQDITSITTTQIDVVYTVDSNDLINELMELLKDSVYTESDHPSTGQTAEPENTGSRLNGVTITLHYKNGFRKELDIYSEAGVNYVDYTEIHDRPYELITNRYTTEKNMWNDVLNIMLKGTSKDLNSEQ